jgi:hypothetical protein
MKGDYVGAVAHQRRHVVGWWRHLMMGDSCRLKGSSRGVWCSFWVGWGVYGASFSGVVIREA